MPTAHPFAPPPPPREHGAWAMLVLPPLLGAATAWPPGASALLLVAGLILLFLARHAAVPSAARAVQGKAIASGTLLPRLAWSVFYLAASLGLLLLALRLTPPLSRGATLSVVLATAVLGGAQTLLALAGRERSTAAEVLGMAGLALSAPLVAVASGAPLQGRAAGAGLLALAYFLMSLAYVRAVRRLWRGDRRAVGGCVAAHAALLLVLAGLWRLGWLPGLALLATAPVVVRAAGGLLSPPPTLRALGFREIGVAVLFTAIAAAALLLG